MFDEICQDMGLGSEIELLEREWDLSGEIFPGPEAIFFLSDKFIGKYADIVGVDVDGIAHLVEVASKLRQNVESARFLWHLYYLLWISPNRLDELPVDPPAPGGYSSDIAATQFLLLAMAGCPAAEALHRKYDIPEVIYRDTMEDIGVWVNYFREELGWAAGVSPHISNWLLCHTRGEIFRLGRLQFKTKRDFPEYLRVYRHRVDGKLLALAAPGQRFNSHGYYDGVSGAYDPNAWESVFEVSKGSVTGNQIDAHGYAWKETMTFDLAEWEEYIMPGDNMLDIHIPATGPITPMECMESISLATVFFKKYFPDNFFKGFICTSWLLDPQFKDFIPADSNILAFQRLGMLFPVPDESETVWRVFGLKARDDGINSVQHKTSLQRSLAEFAKDGGRFRSGGMLITIEN